MNVLSIDFGDEEDIATYPFYPEGMLVWNNIEKKPIQRITVWKADDRDNRTV